MKITVFGGSGFLGSHVSDQLSEAGHKVCIFDCVESPWLRSDQKMILGDLLDEERILDFVEGVKIIDDRGQVKTELDINPDVNEMYLKEVDWFLGCVRGDLDTPVDGTSGKRVLEIVLAANLAAKNNREIQV